MLTSVELYTPIETFLHYWVKQIIVICLGVSQCKKAAPSI